MHKYCIQTLVDISDPGELNKQFPFTSKSGDLIQDKETLALAKNQKSNFTTLIQLLQMRGNIIYSEGPIRSPEIVDKWKMGNFYTGKQNMWFFTWMVEQPDTYREDTDPIGALLQDFDAVPVNAFCKESVTFPANAFLTQDYKFKNTQFTYLGVENK